MGMIEVAAHTLCTLFRSRWVRAVTVRSGLVRLVMDLDGRDRGYRWSWVVSCCTRSGGAGFMVGDGAAEGGGGRAVVGPRRGDGFSRRTAHGRRRRLRRSWRRLAKSSCWRGRWWQMMDEDCCCLDGVVMCGRGVAASSGGRGDELLQASDLMKEAAYELPVLGGDDVVLSPFIALPASEKTRMGGGCHDSPSALLGSIMTSC
ncbi:hypothetical protein ACLOJK_004028 [Asimina triloba]